LRCIAFADNFGRFTSAFWRRKAVPMNALITPLSLYDKLWDSHIVRTESDGTTLLYIDRHLVHEVTSPQAFEGLRLAGRQPWRIGLTSRGIGAFWT